MHTDYNEDFLIAIFSLIVAISMIVGYINVHKVAFLITGIFCCILFIFELYVAIKCEKDNK